ncbi:MAG TPA: hypothetical protein VHD56_07350 [Tepidisphaeraceae bacterium]|nr:hypothetical protein [Tepidisphaeraceae bacterium]
MASGKGGKKSSRPLRPKPQVNQPAPITHAPVDNDLSIMPAPSPAMFVQPLTRSKSQPRLYKSSAIRLTVLPFLLTYGVVLPTLGFLWFWTEDDSPFRAAGIVLPLGLIGFGLVLLGTGILNVMHFRKVRYFSAEGEAGSAGAT